MAANSQETRDRIMARTCSPEHLHQRVLANTNPGPGGCWEWTGPRSHLGYGRFNIGRGKFPAHRVTYELYIGTIPEGLEIDHLCHNRACVNPTHLEPVTRSVNMDRSGHSNFLTKTTNVCKRGHTMTDAYVNPRTGGRACRSCLDLSYQRRKTMRRESSRARREQGERKGQ